MMRPLLLLFVAASIEVFAQPIPLINSGKVLQEAAVLSDSGEFDLAIDKLLTIPPRDTNYVVAQTKLARAYLKAGKYSEAQGIASAVLRNPSSYRASMRRIQIEVYADQKAFERAIRLAKELLVEFPFDAGIRYLLATLYHNSHDYEKAIDAYFHVLEIAPYYSGAHLNLARIASWHGQQTHAMMSQGVYLMIQNKDKAELRFLENILSLQSNQDFNAQWRAPNAFDRLDRIIRSKVAMEKEFKTAVPVDAATVKQFELMFTQLNTVSSGTPDKWLSYYLSIYQTLRDNKLVVPFLNHILLSADIQSVTTWRDRNEASIDAFVGAVNKELSSRRLLIGVPPSLGIETPASAVYTDNNLLDGIGGMKDGKQHGKWMYFHDNSQKSAEGNFSNGAKTGLWTYYYDNGRVKSTQVHPDGEVKSFNVYGEPVARYFLKNEKVEGPAELFNACGDVIEKREYVNGEISGKVQVYYNNGKLKSDFEYKDGARVGVWTEYHPNGQVSAKSTYVDNKLVGEQLKYWSSGELMEKGHFTNGIQTGEWVQYHSNGKVSYAGRFENDYPVGDWKYYSSDGVMTETRQFDASGRYHGVQVFYHNGKPWYKQKYVDGRLIEVVNLAPDGAEKEKFGAPNGTFSVKYFHPNGAVASEGQFENGERSGKWIGYNKYGLKKWQNMQKNGELDGAQFEYFPNGQKKVEAIYNLDKSPGYYREYFITGAIATEGWRADGKWQQQVKRYRNDGTLQTDSYYIDDVARDSLYMYSSSNTLATVQYHRDGELIYERATDDKGRIVFLTERVKKSSPISYSNGQLQIKGSAACGILEGPYERYYPDGSLFTSQTYINASLQGPFRSYYPGGTLQSVGSYQDGLLEGIWKFYNSAGILSQVSKLVRGNNDSLVTNYYEHGPLFNTTSYVDDERSGLMKIFGPDGTLIVEKIYSNDLCDRYRVLGKNGVMSDWIDFKPEGSIQAYYFNGQIAFEENFKFGLFQGKKRIWYPDGKICREHNYVNGDFEGPFINNYPSGKPIIRGEYKLDELTGVVETFSPNGVILNSFEYKAGEKNGSAKLYADGKLIKELVYFDDLPTLEKKPSAK